MNSDFKELLQAFNAFEVGIHYLSKTDLILAKTLAARPQDLADLDELRRAGE